MFFIQHNYFGSFVKFNFMNKVEFVIIIQLVFGKHLHYMEDLVQHKSFVYL